MIKSIQIIKQLYFSFDCYNFQASFRLISPLIIIHHISREDQEVNYRLIFRLHCTLHSYGVRSNQIFLLLKHL